MRPAPSHIAGVARCALVAGFLLVCAETAVGGEAWHGVAVAAEAGGWERQPADTARVARDPGERVRAAARSGPIDIDGRLDEAAWAAAPATAGFVAGEPVEGALPQDDTEVRVVFDDEALYVGLRMWDRDPASIRRQLTRRNEESDAYDYVEVAFDPDLDRRTAYAFGLTAAGVQIDRYRYDDVQDDGSWEAVWEGAVAVDERGWTAELRIPLSQLRFESSPDPQDWGINVVRRKVSTGEVSYLSLESRQRYGGVSAFALLEEIHLPERPRRFELRPFVLSSVERVPADEENPFRGGTDTDGQIGVDGRYGLGSTFVLDFTLNPDFGQVEVDPAVVNLTAFETFFPERRPFFTRDDRLLDFSLPGPRNTLFYSRRIGRAPQGRPPSGADAHWTPRESRLLGATKLTGRTAGGLSLGALAALTDETRGRAWWSDDDRMEGFLAEPQTRFAVARVRQDLRGGASQVGAILTHTSRALPADGRMDFLPSSSHTVGVDFEHAWSGREWALSGHLTASHVRGAADAILRIQTSSIHNFQRPDAPHLDVDPDATSLTAHQWHVTLNRRGGSRLTGGTWLGRRTPGHEVNDLGFSSAAERVYGGGRLQFQEIRPGRVFREYSFSAFTFQSFRNSVWGGEEGEGRMDSWVGGPLNLNADFVLLNYWEIEAAVGLSPSVLDDRLTRGGPLVRAPAERSVELSVGTDRRAALSGNLSLAHEQAGAAGHELQVEAELLYRPSARVEIEVGSSFLRGFDRAQYVTALDDPAYEPTYGRRYVFADLRRRELSLDTRLSVVVSPTLTLQLFAQPLLSSGDFVRFKQLREARGFDFDPVAEGSPAAEAAGERSFTVGSLRGNAVLRWEYRPGSQVYLVWQQRRRDAQAFGDFDLDRDAGALLRAPAENVFMVKVSYWLGL